MEQNNKKAPKQAKSAKKPAKKAAPKMEESVASSATPLFTEEIVATSTRRNKAGSIHRTDRFKNITDGVVPYKYTYGVTNKSNLDIRDTVILCQKAYYNFAIFRNTIDMMTEFNFAQTKNST